MMTMCSLDGPQLSTTLEEESHPDPASCSHNAVSGYFPGKLCPSSPSQVSSAPFPSSPGRGGASLVSLRGRGRGWLGLTGVRICEGPTKPKTLYNHGFFLERILTFGAHRLSFKLKNGLRKAWAARSCPLSFSGGRGS